MTVSYVDFIQYRLTVPVQKTLLVDVIRNCTDTMRVLDLVVDEVARSVAPDVAGVRARPPAPIDVDVLIASGLHPVRLHCIGSLIEHRLVEVSAISVPATPPHSSEQCREPAGGHTVSPRSTDRFSRQHNFE